MRKKKVVSPAVPFDFDAAIRAKTKRPRDIKLGQHGYARVYEAGVSSDGSGSWKAGVDLSAQDGMRPREVRKLMAWLDHALIWLERPVIKQKANADA